MRLRWNNFLKNVHRLMPDKPSSQRSSHNPEETGEDKS